MITRRGQITIFIIIAILIVAALLLFFLFLNNNNPIKPLQPEPTDTEQYIQKCVKDESLKTIDILLRQGGQLNPTNFKLYKDQSIAYLCYTNLFYTPCTTQEPLFIKHLEDEITVNITSGVGVCFQNLKTELEAKGYAVNLGPMQIKTQLGTGRVKVEVERKINLAKNEETKNFDKITTVFNSPLYNLAVMAQEIASQEAKYCHAAYDGMMLFYPEFEIEKKSVGSGETTSKIYIIGDKHSGKKLNIAIRSCAISSGF